MKKLLIALIVFGFLAPGLAFGQSVETRVDNLEENMAQMQKEGMKLKESYMTGFHFYGKIRPQVGYYSTGDNLSPEGPLGDDGNPGFGPLLDTSIGGADDDGLAMKLTSSTRLGAQIKPTDSLTGLYELGFKGTGDVYTRLAWGTWDFGGGKLSLGQYYTPATFLGYSAMVAGIGDGGYGNMLLAGLPYIGRNNQIRLAMGNFDIALIEKSSLAGTSFALGGVTDYDVDSTIPRIEAAYVFDLGMVNIRPIAGFQTYDVEFGGQEETVDSYLLGLGASFDLSPAYVKVTGTYLQNASNYGDMSIMSGGLYAKSGFASWDGVNQELEDSTTVKGTLVGGFDVNENVNIEGGIGYMSGEVDRQLNTTTGTYGDFEETAYLYYLQSRIRLAEGLDMYPGIGLVDLDESEFGGVTTDRDDMFYVNVAFDVYF